ncbi:hypothetical protein FPQ18DRAFT_422116 [Pyronema domesticum]|nr:hypothetical protein FPQ18DRAFT_422116 [Pyronema domesticum]
MPKKFDDAFVITIRRIQEQPKARARQAMEVLKWTLLSKRKLTVVELCHALAISPGDTHLDRDNFPAEISLVQWCLGLVIFDKETSSIRLVHKSLFEYLNRQHEENQLFQRGQSEIAQVCLTYMDFEDSPVEIALVTYDIFGFLADITEKDTQTITEHLDKFCLLGYAIRNWGFHLIEDTSEGTKDLTIRLFLSSNNMNISRGFHHLLLSDKDKFRPSDIQKELRFFKHCENPRKLNKSQDSFTPSFGLYAAAYFNELSILESLLEKDSDKIDLKWFLKKRPHFILPLKRATKRLQERS